MAKLILSLSFILLFSFTLALREGSWQQGECHLSRINAREPTFRLEAEGGVTEFWDHTNDEFQCAGVSIHRHRINPRGLVLPAYHNAPVLVYVVRGRGTLGYLISGCPETFESSQESQQEYYEERGEEGRSHIFRDKHQKVREIRQGYVFAIPAGAAHWTYNNGEEELVTVAVQDVANYANQLDRTPRSFYLAGNPLRGQQQQEGRPREQRGLPEFGNVFRGFKVRPLSEAFRVDEETARLLRGENDTRGHIIRAEQGIQFVSPTLREEYGRREGQYGRGEGPYYTRDNGIEETICTAEIKENLDKPSRADIYNPRAGRFSTLNSLTLPILRFIRLSAARGVLYRDAIMAPHWFLNAHSAIYFTRGECRMQIVNHLGQAVFDGQVREGQVIVVPQNFAAVKQAGEQGCEWIEFNTNDNAMMNTLSGRTSAFRAMPVDVIANAYQISREQAERLKYSRRETLLFSGSSSRYERGRVASA
ncbi:hypothetical protein CDL12_26661 [Handroanthus impetiginosus]|uniref:Cupin type-1 domain-containing protein n=1 Tax=Handroanthus impetiginosus TaxID=429701 RepID=A0A2G9G697_9LAMI|nr:hypothetical protein CDL12_26661 [Handroanthus impetiginosus]